MPLLARAGIECRTQLGRSLAGLLEFLDRDAKRVKEGRERPVRTRPGGHALRAGDKLEPVEVLGIAGFEQCPCPFELGLHGLVFRRLQLPRRGARPALAGRRRAIDFRRRAVFHNQSARSDEAGDLRIAEFPQ